MATIRDLLPDPPINYSVTPDETVVEAVRIMGDHNVGIVMVLDGNKLEGVFSERDLIRRVLNVGKDLGSTKISEVMTKRVVCAGVDDDAEACLKKMEHEGCRHLPVLADDKPLGMLSVRDLMRYVLRNKEFDLKMLEDYVANP